MVTHDLGEAIVMSNRVIILSNRPATIKEDVPAMPAGNPGMGMM